MHPLAHGKRHGKRPPKSEFVPGNLKKLCQDIGTSATRSGSSVTTSVVRLQDMLVTFTCTSPLSASLPFSNNGHIRLAFLMCNYVDGGTQMCDVIPSSKFGLPRSTDEVIVKFL